MSQLNTIALRDALIDRVTDFALDDHFVRDAELAGALRKLWSGRPETGGLGSDLWVEGAFPSTSAPGAMDDLVNTRSRQRGTERATGKDRRFSALAHSLQPSMGKYRSGGGAE